MPLVTKVIDHHPEIGLVPSENERLFALQLETGVYAGHKPLSGRFLITGGPVYLPGQVQPLDTACFQGVDQFSGGNGIIFYRIGGTDYFRFLQPGDGGQYVLLGFERQARRKSIDVDLVRVQAFRLQERTGAGRDAGTSRPCPRWKGNTADLCLLSSRCRGATYPDCSLSARGSSHWYARRSRRPCSPGPSSS